VQVWGLYDFSLFIEGCDVDRQLQMGYMYVKLYSHTHHKKTLPVQLFNLLRLTLNLILIITFKQNFGVVNVVGTNI